MAKLVFIGVGTLMIPMCTFFGILALFGGQTVTIGQSHITGFSGLALGILYGFLFTGIFGAFAWPAAYLGIRIWGSFTPLGLEMVTETSEPNQSVQTTPTAVTSAAEQPARQP
jgi:hypothetical protein